MNKNDLPASTPDALVSTLVDPGMSLTPEIRAVLRARLDWLLFQRPPDCLTKSHPSTLTWNPD
jgi:hypothetical protein